jgi:adenosine deaminase
MGRTSRIITGIECRSALRGEAKTGSPQRRHECNSSLRRADAAQRGEALRRRTVLAVILAVVLLAAFVVVVRVAVVAGDFDTMVTAARFEAARNDHSELRAFLRRMPKGGDLHTHLSGAVYAERFIAWGAQEHLCADFAQGLLSKPHCDQPGDVPVADAMHDQNLYDRLVNAFSTRAFVPTVTVPTDHDKFFAAFDKFAAASRSHFVDMMIDQLKEYHSENVQYVEFMTSFYCPNDRDKFIAAMADQKDDATKLAALQASGLDECVAAKRNELTAAIGKIGSELACDSQRTQPGCRVTFRYIAQILRNSSLDDVFLQTAIAAALIRAEPQVVALNYVQSEDNLVARRDYTRHMQIVAFLAKDVPVALHAGELWLGYVPPPDLTFHIRQAVEIANARRIGHGVDLAFEHDMDGLLAEMRARPVVVEINLSSNDIILGVRGKDHPLPTYLAAGVPVVLSSDDAGVSRISLSNEYFRAARDYGLGYRALKAIARNALVHSFLDEEQKRDELERFDRACVQFERSVASRQSPRQNVVALIKAAVAPLP